MFVLFNLNGLLYYGVLKSIFLASVFGNLIYLKLILKKIALYGYQKTCSVNLSMQHNKVNNYLFIHHQHHHHPSIHLYSNIPFHH